MRASLAILSLPLLSLAACGGGSGLNTIGSLSPPSEPTPGQTFLDVSSSTTFNAVGSLQSYQVDATTVAALYQGNASTVNAPGGSVTYDPRDGIFTLILSDSAAGVTQNLKFQDPAHRTDFQSLEVPDLAGYNYLASSDGQTAVNSFFYQRPGTTTSYVTLAGFVHTDRDEATGVLTNSQRGVMVFGDQTPMLSVPTSGSGHFDGDFLATMVNGTGANPLFQWINGTSAIDVDFGKGSLALALDGTVGSSFAGNPGDPTTNLAIANGATFSAAGAASILASAGTFSGSFSSAFFKDGNATVPIDFTSVNPTTNVAGGSSIDGAFYGPKGVEVGGNFRIVGGVPDQRVDILGGFTGKR